MLHEQDKMLSSQFFFAIHRPSDILESVVFFHSDLDSNSPSLSAISILVLVTLSRDYAIIFVKSMPAK